MKKYTFSCLLAFLLLTACGSSRKALPRGATHATVTRDSLPLIPLNTLDIVEEEVNGPFLEPDIPATIYQPFLRRDNTPAPALPLPENSCHLAVEVRNYDGLDGCGILLETDAGNLLLVGSAPRGEPLEAGTRLSIGYELIDNYAGSTCANADAVIHVTCKRLLRVSSGVPRPVVCEAYERPGQWLHDLAIDYSATYITRFPWKEGRYVYLLESPMGQYLYDCRGYQICQPRKNCLSFIEDFSKGVIIYEGK